MKTNKSSKVSICIPTYNYAHFLSQTIESVLSQTFSDFELLIVDNCSTDNTSDVVKKYSNSDQRITYFRNESNLGMVGNWNRCLQLATGEYIKILCADDLLEPLCIERSVIMLEANPNVILVTGARLLINESLLPMGTLAFSHTLQIISGFEVINKCLVYGNLIGEPSAAMFRRNNAGQVFNSHYKQLMDLEMWFRLLEQGDLASLPEVLCKFRLHSAQGTNASVRSLSFADDDFLLLKEYMKKDYITLSLIQKQIARFNKAYIIWDRRGCYSFKKMVQKMSQHYSLILFVFLFVVLKIKGALLRLFVKRMNR